MLRSTASIGQVTTHSWADAATATSLSGMSAKRCAFVCPPVHPTRLTFRKGHTDELAVRPSIYVGTDTSPLISICVQRIPPLSADGQDLAEEEPTSIFASSFSAAYHQLDIRDPYISAQVTYERGAFASHLRERMLRRSQGPVTQSLGLLSFAARSTSMPIKLCGCSVYALAHTVRRLAWRPCPVASTCARCVPLRRQRN